MLNQVTRIRICYPPSFRPVCTIERAVEEATPPVIFIGHYRLGILHITSIQHFMPSALASLSTCLNFESTASLFNACSFLFSHRYQVRPSLVTSVSHLPSWHLKGGTTFRFETSLFTTIYHPSSLNLDVKLPATGMQPTYISSCNMFVSTLASNKFA